MRKKIKIIILILFIIILFSNIASSQMLIIHTEFTFFGGFMSYKYIPTSTVTRNFDMCLEGGIDVYYLFTPSIGMNIGAYWDGFGGHGDWASNDVDDSIDLSLLYNGVKFTGGLSFPIFLDAGIMIIDANAFTTLYINPNYTLDNIDYYYNGVYIDAGVRIKVVIMPTFVYENGFILSLPAALIFEKGFLDVDPDPNSEIRKMYIGISLGLSFGFINE